MKHIHFSEGGKWGCEVMVDMTGLTVLMIMVHD